MGGRVLGVSAVGDTLEEALQLSYEKIKEIQFTDMHYRTDIGRKVVNNDSIPLFCGKETCICSRSEIHIK